ncbi:respiratory nitrate reductase 1 subunit gamma [Escherichia coli]|nr:respiratory nitrate reductase 1 subunit gamma [Escherichia coli]
MQFLNMFFFDIYPYIAGAVFLIGSWLRYDYGQYTWRAASSQMLDRKGMNLASNLFHIGILGIFVGHFFGMLTPHWMYEAWLPIEVKQKMAMFAGGASGVLCLIGGVLLLKRRLFSPRVACNHYWSGYPDPVAARYPVRAGPADHSVLRSAYGR